jgi:putative DNA primase/helicase
MTDSPDTSLPKGNFRAGEDGLFTREEGGIERWVCEPIWRVGNALGTDGTRAADVVVFRDRVGNRRRTVIPHKDSIIRSSRLFETLADEFFVVPEDKNDRKLLSAYLADSRKSSTQMYLLAHCMGWHGSSFVIGHDVISTDDSERLILSGPIAQYAAKFDQKGSLSGYQSKVLRRASHSSRGMAGIVLALLAPLARIIGLENGGLNIVGPAAIGKTTILRVIGSFYGGGTVPYIESWLMTDNAPATLGFAHCDLPLLLDETDALEPDQTKAGSRLKALVHRLALGQRKAQRHRAFGNDSTLTDFHVIFGSTSEHRLAAFMREGGSKITGGQAARLVDLPADAGRGLKIFEKLPRGVTADQYLQKLNRACHQ